MIDAFYLVVSIMGLRFLYLVNNHRTGAYFIISIGAQAAVIYGVIGAEAEAILYVADAFILIGLFIMYNSEDEFRKYIDEKYGAYNILLYEKFTRQTDKDADFRTARLFPNLYIPCYFLGINMLGLALENHIHAWVFIINAMVGISLLLWGQGGYQTRSASSAGKK